MKTSSLDILEVYLCFHDIYVIVSIYTIISFNVDIGTLFNDVIYYSLGTKSSKVLTVVETTFKSTTSDDLSSAKDRARTNAAKRRLVRNSF